MKLQEITVPAGGQATIDFTAIPATYKHLVIEFVGRGDTAANSVHLYLQANGDTAANYDWQESVDLGGVTNDAGARAVTVAKIAEIAGANAPANAPGTVSLALPQYASTVWRKMGTSQWVFPYDDTGGTSFQSATSALCWRNTAAITRLTLSLAAGNFASGSVATLYGVDGAATGGGGNTVAPPYVCVQDQKATGTLGGTTVTGAWHTRDLNTKVADASGLATVASNQITLAAGTYRAQAFAMFFRSNGDQLRLQNITAGTTLAVGLTGSSDSGASSNVPNVVGGQFTLAVASVIELQYQAQNGTPYGLGYFANLGPEIYAMVELWKVA